VGHEEKLMPGVAADCGGSHAHVKQLCAHEFLARQLRDRLLVISKSATIIIAPQHHDGVSRHSLTDRLRAQLGKVEQDRDQDDREHVAARKGNAGRDENGLQSGQCCEKL
jgi:hypothetical protein